MKTLFNEPIHWIAGAVGTNARLALMLACLTVMLGAAVIEAASGNWRSAAVLGLIVIWFQFLLLYAMRAIYLRWQGLVSDMRTAHRPAQAGVDATAS